MTLAQAKLPWAKFYFSAWRSEPSLRVCSLAARGLWMEMLGLMHEAEPYGHLLLNGKPITAKQLAGAASASVDEVETLLLELENAGVFSRNRNGVPYSRRMTRDEKRRKDGDKSQKTGQIQGSRRHRQAVDTVDGNLPPPQVATQPPPLPPHSLESRVVEKREVSKEETPLTPQGGEVAEPPRGEQQNEGGEDHKIDVPGKAAGKRQRAKPDRPDQAAEMFAIWQSIFADKWPMVTVLTPKRRDKLNLRLAEDFDGDVEHFRDHMQRVRETPTLMGSMSSGWVASLDWMLEPKNILAVREERYDWKPPTTNGARANGNGSHHDRLTPHEALFAGFAQAARELAGDDDPDR